MCLAEDAEQLLGEGLDDLVQVVEVEQDGTSMVPDWRPSAAMSCRLARSGCVLASGGVEVQCRQGKAIRVPS